jgi:hypothetical protein
MMSDLDEKRVIEASDQDGRGNEDQSRAIGLASENSPEETIRRKRAFPERAAKLRELISALRERNPD